VVTISCNLLPNPRIVEQARLAERLGYHCVYVADSPALYGDVWVSVARIAEATDTVGVGTGVLVPHTRHPMVNAAAIATIESIAPGRLVLGVGAGNSARRCLGDRTPSPQRWMAAYLAVLRRLLRGEIVDWEGKRLQLIPPSGYLPPFPMEVPILLNASGPKGLATAREHADGVIGPLQPGFERNVVLQWGTVLDDGEDLTSSWRAVLAHAPLTLTALHNRYEDDPATLDAIPGGVAWRDRVDRLGPPEEAHLRVHQGHCVEPPPQDLDVLTPEFLEWSRPWTMTGTRAEVKAGAESLAASGATEILYLPAGPDIDRELEAFADAVRS
jgi:5,10-methylenetetrahydromethanopterin reductase